VFENLLKLDKPTLSLVAGPALGAGSILAPACAMCLAPPNPAKFGHPEIKGAVFNTVAAALLPRLVGRKKAYEMLLGGGSVSAVDAGGVGALSPGGADD